ncbi:MAG TPA: hypothetical protein VK771_08950, partial [Acidimicrobiia bacterium]|nr:hypothetical protein [Acidimicrobiia bacterium]
MTIDTAVATINGQSYAVTGYANPVAQNATTFATTLVPGGVNGTITLTVHAVWPDNFSSTQSTSVALDSQCTTSTPSTTS